MPLLLCACANLLFAEEDFEEGLGKIDVGEVFGIGKEGGDFIGRCSRVTSNFESTIFGKVKSTP